MRKLSVAIALIIFLVPTFLIAAGGTEQANPPINWMRTTTGTVLYHNQVSMTQAAAVIRLAPTSGHYRHSLVIRNLDAANTVYLGAFNVTSTNGFPLKAGETITLDRNYATVYGICAAGLTATVAYLEEGF